MLNYFIFFVKLIPADDVLDASSKFSEDVVYFPLIKVAGQKDPFRKLVDVELVYRHVDITELDTDFLPIGNKVPFSSEYGKLFRSHTPKQGNQAWKSAADDVNAKIERLENDQVRVTFSVSHFST